VEPRARVSVWPGRRRVPDIVAPDSWGARGAECLPRDVLRRSSPATSPCDDTTARRCLCHGTGSGTTEARPPESSVPPAPHGGLGGVIVPPGQFRAGFSERQDGQQLRHSPRHRSGNNSVRDASSSCRNSYPSIVGRVYDICQSAPHLKFRGRGKGASLNCTRQSRLERTGLGGRSETGRLSFSATNRPVGRLAYPIPYHTNQSSGKVGAHCIQDGLRLRRSGGLG